jgi:hypothetical protein
MNFIKYSGFIGDGECVYEGDLFIHPFSIEAFMGVEMSFSPEGENEVAGDGVKIYMKSGKILDIMIGVKEFQTMMQIQAK